MMWFLAGVETPVIYILIFPLLGVIATDNLTCERALLEAETLFYNESFFKLSFAEKLSLTHGNKNHKKCKYFARHLSEKCQGQIKGHCCDLQMPDVRRKRQYYTPTCNQYAVFRTIDGSCNNLANPEWGMGDKIQARVLPNAYQDGKTMPRSQGCNGTLPSARIISSIVHAAGETSDIDKTRSAFIMLFGQFLAHDIVQTPIVKEPNGDVLDCCGDDSAREECFTISVPEDDPHFMPSTCMSFTRSEHLLDSNGVRQQKNKHSAYLDLSMVYGTSSEQAMSLREQTGGKMKNIGTALSNDPESDLCELDVPANPPAIYCPTSGDSRVNENPALASLHTIFHREHNRLAEGLAAINMHWDDENLYQTARKINIGQFEHIVYNEYLPETIGSEIMEENNINVEPTGFKDTYNSSIDATVFNAFSTAAFRFGHSMIPDVLQMVGFDFVQKRAPEQLKDHFFRTELYHTYDKLGLEYLLMGMANAPCPLFDRKFEDSVRQNLFLHSDDSNLTQDLVALNIQRGRDHGLPGYNDYREFCGLPRASNFNTSAGGLVDHKPEVAALLQQAYQCPDDIDLFSGLVSEMPSRGSQVGPTTQCLLLKQFKRLRDGDRFFYERRDDNLPNLDFTEDQLNEIKKIRMSTLFCLNTNAEKIQGNMFLKIDRADGKRGSCYRKYMSKLEDCQNKTGIDLSLWQVNMLP